MSKNSGLGHAIKNRVQKKYKSPPTTQSPLFYQQSQQNQSQKKKLKMKSIIQQNSLSQFLQTAQLSQHNFNANRDVKFKCIKQEIKQKKIAIINHKQILIQDDIDQNQLKGLQLPRRPNWKQSQTKQQLQKQQAQAYLTWRRNLSTLQQSSTHIKITPYQKNIQVWKQLWRVTERVDLMVQIVDGRDPLFFRSEDLVQYIHQINQNKKSLLLINKSDLVPQQTRLRWNKYLNQHSIHHLFFSAKLAQGQPLQQQQNNDSTQNSQRNQINTQNKIIQHHFNKSQIISTKQLILLLNQYATIFNKNKIQVGFVGYPNVGKSSVINVLLGKKKVAVTSLPGKTKHFQTLILSDKVTLCDCPGLVFPRISASHAYMVLNGLYSIDTLKAYIEPMTILTQRIPKTTIQEVYSLHWKDNQVYDGNTLMNKWATLKGYFTGNALPNQCIAAKNILKDYINGVIIYARNPPGFQAQADLITQHSHQKQNPLKTSPNCQSSSRLTHPIPQNPIQQNLDSQFFIQPKAILDQQTLIKNITQDDLLDMIQGKKYPGIKLTKQMRHNLKHALKRGEKLNEIKKKYFHQSNDNGHKKFITS